MNTVGGFSCRPCPPGLWGAPLAGTGLDYAKTHRQVRRSGFRGEGGPPEAARASSRTLSPGVCGRGRVCGRPGRLRVELGVRQHCGESSPSLNQHGGALCWSLLTHTLCSQGSYKCGGCKPGFLGNQTSGCLPRQSCAALTFNPCDANAHCTMERNGEVACRVSTARSLQHWERCRGYRW